MKSKEKANLGDVHRVLTKYAHLKKLGAFVTKKNNLMPSFIFAGEPCDIP
jgi:hypothetical protein